MLNGEGELKYYNGLIYKGNWNKGLKEGKGKYILPNGAIYEGCLLNGLPHKIGVYYGAAGDLIEKYEGEWINGLMNGKGTLTLQNRDGYHGSFQNNSFHGEGIFCTATGAKFEGKWEYGTLFGQSNISFPNISLIDTPVLFNRIMISPNGHINMCPLLSLLPSLPPIICPNRKCK